MLTHKKFAVSLALAAALALSVPTWALAMGGGMMGGAGGMMGGLLSAMGNMMGSNKQNPPKQNLAANQPQAPQEPGYPAVGPAYPGNPGYGPQDNYHMGIGNPGMSAGPGSFSPGNPGSGR